MTLYFEIRAEKDYRWPEPLGKKGKAVVVMADAGRITCGRLYAHLDNYPYVGLDIICDGVSFRATHRHSRLYWDGCVWTAQTLEDVRWRLSQRVPLVINGKRHGGVSYDEFERAVREDAGDGKTTTENCHVAITDPRVRFLALASLAHFDRKGAKAKCDLYARLNPSKDEAVAALRRFGLDVDFAPHHATETVVYGHLKDFSKASATETPAQILGRTIPIRVEVEEPVKAGDPGCGTLALSLSNEQYGVVLRGVETTGGVKRTYAFRVPTEWARKNVVEVIERMSVTLTMQNDRTGHPDSHQIRIVKGDGAFSLRWGSSTDAKWYAPVRMAKKLRLVYDMLKANAAEGVEEIDARLLGEFKIAAVGHVKGAEKACSLLAPGAELRLERDKDNPHDANAIKVVNAEDGTALGYVQRTLNTELVALMGEYVEIAAKVEAPCSHLGKHSACVVVVRKS